MRETDRPTDGPATGGPTPSGQEIEISWRQLNRWLAVCLAIIIAATLGTEVLSNSFNEDWLFGFVPLVSINNEENIPTWYVSALLLLCAVLLRIIAVIKRRADDAFARKWLILSYVFLYISIDETAQIHELINSPAGAALKIGGVLYWPWVIPATLLVAVFAYAYIGFLRALPRRFARLFFLSGAVYVGGALGTEFPLGYWYDLRGSDNYVYGLSSMVQESLEILGASIFCSTLLAYIGTQLGSLRIAVMDTMVTPVQAGANKSNDRMIDARLIDEARLVKPAS